MPYEKFDKVEAIVNLFQSNHDKESLRLKVKSILNYEPKWIRDCDCRERGQICDCQQLSER